MQAMEINAFTLPALFDQSAPADTRKTLYFDLSGQEITFAIFYNRVELVTELLKKQGVKRGDVVAIFSDNVANWACAYFAIARTGAIALPLLQEMSDHDLALFLNAHRVRLVFTSDLHKERLARLDVKSLTTLVSMENFAVETLSESRERVHEKWGREFARLKKAAIEFIRLTEAEDPLDTKPEDPFCILYVPDETNRWQQIYLTHQNIISAAVNISRQLELSEHDRIAVFLPLSLTLPALLGILIPLLVNAQAVLLTKPNDERQLQSYLNQFQPTHLFADSSFAEWVFKKAQTTEKRGSLLKRSLWLIDKLFLRVSDKIEEEFVFPQKYHWLICTNFAPLGKQLKRFLRERQIAHHLLFGHFQSCSLFLVGQATDDFVWMEGKMLPEFEWYLSSENDSKTGELCIKGPMVSLNKSDRMASSGGYLKTGWMARQKDDSVQILGPSIHLIALPEGMFVFPELIEATLNEYEWVAESLVYLEGDALFVRLYPDPGKVGPLARQHPERLAMELLQTVTKHLPPYAHLKGVSIESEPFAKNAFGQILR